MILIITDKYDLHTEKVIKYLENKGKIYYQLNLEKESLLKTTFTFSDFQWVIVQNEKRLNSSEVSCVWNRRTYVELLLAEAYDVSPDFRIWKSEWNKTLLGFYLSISHVPWLNYYRNAERAENKYLQMQFAKELAFKMPEILVSNDKKKLLSFVNKYPKVVLKLMHQDFYRTNDNEYKGIYVNTISIDNITSFSEDGENPIVLQEYIEKEYEVRYTVIGNAHFACRIDSQFSEKTKIDWRRYDIPNTPHSIVEIPNEIKEKVKLLMQRLQIEYGALDFVVSPNGSWYFLEINSMGQFLWIEDLTGLPISNSIVEWLIQNSN